MPEDADKLVAAYKHFGQEIPKDLIAPELHDVEFALWRSFWDLSTERQAGFDSQGRIRWSALQQYGKITGIEKTEFEQVIRAMDDVYLAVQAEIKNRGKK